MAIYQQADVVVDQMLIGSHGLFAAECMAMGKPVICWISEFMQERYPASLPIVSANPATLTDKLRVLLLDAELRAELGARGRTYAAEYHDMHKIAETLAGLYENALPLPQTASDGTVRPLKETG